MTYAIINVIYGCPIENHNYYDHDIQTPIVEWLNDENKSEEIDNLFVTLYHGSLDVPPMYFGIQLDEFDECTLGVWLGRLKLKPDPEQKSRVDQAFNGLPARFRDDLPPLDTYFIFSTS